MIGRALIAAAFATALFAAGCTKVVDPGFGVALTIDFDSSTISSEALASVTKLEYDASGDETETAESALDRPAMRREKVVYRPLATSRVITIEVSAFDDAGNLVGRGSTASLTLQPGRTTPASVLVIATGALDLGSGGGDLNANEADLGDASVASDAAKAPDLADVDLRPMQVQIRINVDGPDWDGIDYPGHWQGDPRPDGGGTSSTSFCSPNYAVPSPGPFYNTNDGPLFAGEAFGNPLVCSVGGGRLPVGMYQVNLYYSEDFFGTGCKGVTTAPGKRIFDIVLEGQSVLQNFDLLTEADGCICSTTTTTGHPVVKKFTVQINDGSLDLEEPAEQDNGKISAIEVIGPL